MKSDSLGISPPDLGGLEVGGEELFKLAPRHSCTQAFDSEGRFRMKLDASVSVPRYSSDECVNDKTNSVVWKGAKQRGCKRTLLK